jgi:hypothetical protein
VRRPVTQNDPNGGFVLGEEEVAVSPLLDPEVALIFRTDDGPLRTREARRAITALAEHLASTTDIGDRPTPFGLNESDKVQAIADRIVTPLVLHHLKGLSDLSCDDDALIGVAQDELEDFSNATSATVIDQIAIRGPRPERSLTWRGVTLRPLSPAERGAAAEATLVSGPITTAGVSDFVIPRKLQTFFPTALLEVSQKVSWDWYSKEHPVEQVNQLVLAFLIEDFGIGTSESLATFSRPVWANTGILSRRFPMSEGRGVSERSIDLSEFRKVVELASQIPPFGSDERSPKEVCLYRALRGAGGQPGHSGLLDFTISLEAALLPKIDSELSYRFRLYGSLFLRHSLPPGATFKELGSVYKARSKLIHGEVLKRGERSKAEASARRLALAVIGRSVEVGWPRPSELDGLAARMEQ